MNPEGRHRLFKKVEKKSHYFRQFDLTNVKSLDEARADRHSVIWEIRIEHRNALTRRKIFFEKENSLRFLFKAIRDAQNEIRILFVYLHDENSPIADRFAR